MLQIDNQFYIGISERTNEEGARQLSQIMRQYGYQCTNIPVKGGLHLKSDVSYIGQNTLVITETLSRENAFVKYDKVLVDTDEAYAANSLLINDQILTPKGFPHIRQQLISAGFDIIEIETSEMQKMDGGLSCMSLRF